MATTDELQEDREDVARRRSVARLGSTPAPSFTSTGVQPSAPPPAEGPAPTTQGLRRLGDTTRPAGGPGEGRLGGVSVGESPDIGSKTGGAIGVLGAAVTGALGLAPVGALVGGRLTGKTGVIGPVTPQVGTAEFGQVTSAGSEASGLGPGGFSGGSGDDTLGSRGASSDTFGGGRSGGSGRGEAGAIGGGSSGGRGDPSGQGTSSANFRQGGLVSENFQPGQNQPVPATVHEGEFVMRPEAVNAVGLGNLQALNAADGANGGLDEDFAAAAAALEQQASQNLSPQELAELESMITPRMLDLVSRAFGAATGAALASVDGGMESGLPSPVSAQQLTSNLGNTLRGAEPFRPQNSPPATPLRRLG